MVTGVGLTAPSSCAAIRCAISNFTETRFMDKVGEWIIGSQVPLEQPWHGRAKLIQMVVPSIRECLQPLGEIDSRRVVLLLCVAETTRPGRLDGLDRTFFNEIETELGMRFHGSSVVIAEGKVGGIIALREARTLLDEKDVSYCVIAGVDSFLVAGTLAAYEEKNRLATSKNSDGFIPGEAGAAVLVARQPANGSRSLSCIGIGFGEERATVESEEPLKADGLVQAIRAALSEAHVSMGDLDYRITDISGEQYSFKEASLALTRILRQRKERFDLWHPADCIGEVGAAILAICAGVALAAQRIKYAPGKRTLCHLGADNGNRAAAILEPA
jgi:3-oxoacyl-[acyl-carrier-protein] synthase-1